MTATTRSSSNAPQPAPLPPAPVLRVTPYESVSAAVLALFVLVAALAGGLLVVWYSNQQPAFIPAVPVQLIELPGGYEDGAPDETLRVDSPLPENPNAAVGEQSAEVAEISAQLGSLADISQAAAEQMPTQFETGTTDRGVPGSAKGTGRRPLGSGGGTGGYPPEQRWFVQFSDRVSLEEYARQLDFFKIELGALLPDGKLSYLTNLSAPRPTIRTIESGSGEKRLYMTWQGGQRRLADRELFIKAGLELPDQAIVLHFYDPQTEALLAQLEFGYQGRRIAEIRRTYFAVESAQPGYRFTVTRQTYHNQSNPSK